MRCVRARIVTGLVRPALLFLFALPVLALLPIHCGPAEHGPPPGALLTGAPRFTELALSPSQPRIASGTGQSFTVRASLPDGRIKDISAQLEWSVRDDSGRAVPAAVMLPGLITVEHPGRYRVRAVNRESGRAVETSLEVTAATLQSVAISPLLPAIALGTRQRFTLTGTFSDGTTQDVSALAAWSTKSVVGTGVATIDSTGLCTSKAVGKAQVTGRYSTRSASTTLQVTPAVITNLAVTPATPTIAKGTALQFAATATFSDSTVQDVTALADWSVQDITGTGVASIDELGSAVGLSIGQVAVSADYSGATGSTTLTVTAARATGLTVAPASATIARGATRSFTATATFTDGSTQDVSALAAWTASDVSGLGVATVDARGGATATSIGTATITAAYGGFTASATLTVTPPTLTAFATSPATSTIAKGNTRQFTAKGTYSDGSTQDLSAVSTWSVTDVTGTGVASIDARGAAVGKSEGKATITASYLGSTAKSTLTVTAAVVSSLTVTPPSATITTGATQQYAAVAVLSDGTIQDVTTVTSWSTSDVVGTGVAAIDGKGLATAKVEGQATITASYKGKTAKATLAVANGLRLVTVPTTGVLWGLWGTSASDVWTVGENGVILRWNGASWTQATALAGTTGLNAVWGSGARDVWFAGDGGLLIHFDGTTFTASTLSPAVGTVYGLWGSGASDIWAATTSGAYHYDGSSWAPKLGPAGTNVTAVWGSGASDVWFFEGSAIDHWDGSAFTQLPLPAPASIYGVSGSSARDIWAAGSEGNIFHYDGTAWSAVASPTTQLLVGVSALGASDVMFSGDGGTVLRWNGTAFSRVTSPTTEDLMGILRIAGATFITGWNGVLLR